MPRDTTMTPDLRTPSVMDCPVCGLDGGPFPTAAEVRLLADVHDALHHGGHSTAIIRPAPPVPA